METVEPGCPERLTSDDEAALRRLSGSARAAKLLELGRCVAHGTSDELIVEALAELAGKDASTELREAWLTYVSASNAEAFFPLLDRWVRDTDEERRARVVGVLAWNRSPATNHALLRIIEHDGSLRVRRRALKYLVRRGSLGRWEPTDLLALVPESEWRPVTRREYAKLVARSH